MAIVRPEWKQRVDQLAPNVGICLEDSVRQAVDDWNRNNLGKVLTITGYHGRKRVNEMFSSRAVLDHFGIINAEGVHTQGLAAHTGMQAEWIVEKAISLRSNGVALYCPLFHLPRFLLTTLEAFRRRMNSGGDYAMFPVIPVPVIRPSGQKNLLDTIAEKEGGESDDVNEYRTLSEEEAAWREFPRIAAYQQAKADGSPGDCMTTERFGLYTDWLLRRMG